MPAALLAVATMRTLFFRSAPGFSSYIPVRTGMPNSSCTALAMVAQAHAGSLRPDGTIEAELQVITGATNEMGFNRLSAR